MTNKHLFLKPWAFQLLVNRFKEGDIWAVLVGNPILRLWWMDKAHRRPTVTGASYLAMEKEEMWPEGRRPATHTEAVVVAAGWRRSPLHRRSQLSQRKVPWSGDQWSCAGESTCGRLLARIYRRLITTSGVLPMLMCGDRSQRRPWWKKWQPLSTATFFVPSWQIFGKGQKLVSQWKEAISNMH